MLTCALDPFLCQANETLLLELLSISFFLPGHRTQLFFFAGHLVTYFAVSYLEVCMYSLLVGQVDTRCHSFMHVICSPEAEGAACTRTREHRVCTNKCRTSCNDPRVHTRSEVVSFSAQSMRMREFFTEPRFLFQSPPFGTTGKCRSCS